LKDIEKEISASRLLAGKFRLSLARSDEMTHRKTKESR
jgi:hypothetical protein